jgi:hypothetical protein
MDESSVYLGTSTDCLKSSPLRRRHTVIRFSQRHSISSQQLQPSRSDEIYCNNHDHSSSGSHRHGQESTDKMHNLVTSYITISHMNLSRPRLQVAATPGMVGPHPICNSKRDVGSEITELDTHRNLKLAEQTLRIHIEI